MSVDFTIGNLVNDQSSGVQTPTDGNDIDVTLSSNELDGLDGDFESFLAGLGLSAAQKAFAVDADAVSPCARDPWVGGSLGEARMEAHGVGVRVHRMPIRAPAAWLMPRV